jgi:hypothetical protein
LLKNKISEEIKEVIERDPFLVYEGETDSAYKIHNHAEDELIVPKERAVPEPFPARRAEPIRKAYRFLLWATLGLILSGLGAIFLAPAAGLYALRGLNGALSQHDRARGWVILALAVVVFLVGAALAYLLLLHWLG